MTSGTTGKRFIALLTLCLLLVPVASHSIELESLKVVLLGDSYSAGNGARAGSGVEDFFGPPGCYRSHSNWAEQYRNILQEEGHYSITYINRACSGGVLRNLTYPRLMDDKPKSYLVKGYYNPGEEVLKSEIEAKFCTVSDPNADFYFEKPTAISANLITDGDPTRDLTRITFVCKLFLKPQIESVGSDTDVVLMTIGGNDAGFDTIVKQCFVLGVRDPGDCRDAVTFAYGKLPSIKTELMDVLRKLRNERLRPDARVVLLSYPFLALDNDYALKNIVQSYEVAKEVRSLQVTADGFQQSAARQVNEEFGEEFVRFVSEVKGHFGGHEPDGHVDERNPERWIWELMEPSLDGKEWYHTNPRGHTKLADLLYSLGIDTSFPSSIDFEGDVDISFVIDTTGSMGDDISAVKSFATELVSQVASRTKSFRFALVTYRDFPERTGVSYDFASRVELDFSDNSDDILAAINALSLGDGGDVPETVYSGLNSAIGLKWRPGVKKIIVQLGDAPPLDPEPVTNLTASETVARAWAVDPVEVYVVDSSSRGASGPKLTQIAVETGGAVLSAPSPAGIAAALVEIIDKALRKPFAWANGPYVVRIGQEAVLDASGSFDSDGVIVLYEWDVNGDGVFDIAGTSTTMRHVPLGAYEGTITLRVTDDSGLTSVATTYVSVSLDGDGVPDAIDNCPYVANHNQSDYDNDGIGDACDPNPGYPSRDREGVREVLPDGDSDGVLDDVDACLGTPLGVVVDRQGCSIAQVCPCDGPRGVGRRWTNHGEYESCTASAASGFFKQGLITAKAQGDVIAAAARSSCGAR